MASAAARAGGEPLSLSRRERIELTPGERRKLLDSERVVVVSTIGPRGWPHSMPLWFVARDGERAETPEIWVWTYAKSQKVRNLERDPRATLLVETGESYDELQGIQIEAEAEIVRETDRVLELGQEIAIRYGGGVEPFPEEAVAMLAAQAPKRVAIRFRPLRTASWDHAKLGGTY